MEYTSATSELDALRDLEFVVRRYLDGFNEFEEMKVRECLDAIAVFRKKSKEALKNGRRYW